MTYTDIGTGLTRFGGGSYLLYVAHIWVKQKSIWRWLVGRLIVCNLQRFSIWNLSFYLLRAMSPDKSLIANTRWIDTLSWIAKRIGSTPKSLMRSVYFSQTALAFLVRKLETTSSTTAWKAQLSRSKLFMQVVFTADDNFSVSRQC